MDTPSPSSQYLVQILTPVLLHLGVREISSIRMDSTRQSLNICYLKVKGDNSSRTRYGICYLEGHFPNYNVSQTVWVELADKADYTRTVPAHFEEILQRPIVYGQVPLTTRLLNSFRCQ